MEEALQSNETIDIFKNDFELSKTGIVEEASDNKNEKTEVKTFRDNYFGGEKSKKEKHINEIRFIGSSERFVAQTFFRNMSFNERTEKIGIPYQSQILFWDFEDVESNAPVYFVEAPQEMTSFELCPSNIDIIVGALISGQLIVFEINNLLYHCKFYHELDANINKGERLTRKSSNPIHVLYHWNFRFP